MRFKNRICITATVLLMAGLAFANTVWTPLDPNAVVKGYSDWKWTNGTQTNWSVGIPVVPPAPGDPKAVLGASTIECRVTSMTGCGTFSMGDGANAGSKMRIVNGGTLYTSQGGDTDSWSAIGYSAPTTMIVEDGGTLQIAGRLGIGWFTWAGVGQSQLLVEGGYVKVGATAPSNLQLGTDGADAALHPGYINVTKGGLIEVSGGLVFNNSDGSNINLEFGSIVFSSNQKTLLDTRIAGGKVKGWGGLTTPTAVFSGGRTTLSAPDPYNRNPAYTIVKGGSVNLTWTNMAPVAPATDVWVDVWFGTDPNKLNPATYTKVLTQGKNATSFTVTAPAPTPTTYYWEVNWYRYGDPALVVYKPTDPNGPSVDAGEATPFTAVADTPPSVVINTLPTATWIGEPLQLDSTVTDDGASTVTYLWTASKGGVSIDPNVVFSPSNTVADPTVTVDYHSGPFTVTVTVADSNPLLLTDDASVNHDCAIDACQATTAVINLDVQHPGDTALDCNLNLEDFAVYARNWLDNYQLTAPVPQ
jgi:hypothetical protein